RWLLCCRRAARPTDLSYLLPALGLHLGRVVGHELLGDGGRRKLPLRDLRHSRDLGGATSDEALRELGELIEHDAPLDHLDAPLLRKLDDGAAGDAIEEAIRNRRMNLSVPDEEKVCAGAFRDAALPVQHHGIRITFSLGAMPWN